ncbi:YmfL family putative regulatory protein [Trinickia violacea]|nr:YmfL family putative regulatory protein [Trinickia violacea]
MLRKAICKMIRAFPGGWPAMAGALGMSQSALENRVYERSGQRLHLDTALQMQTFSGTTLLAEEIARRSGGIFVKVPDVLPDDRDALLAKFNALHAELGDFSRDFSRFAARNEIGGREFAVLEADGERAIRTVEELLILIRKLYCRVPVSVIGGALEDAEDAV